MSHPSPTPQGSTRSGGATQPTKTPVYPNTVKSASELLQEALASGAIQPSELVMSLGIPSVEVPLFNSDQARYPGIKLGQIWTYLAPSGQGKSVICQFAAAASAMCILAYGLTDCDVIVAINEDEDEFLRRYDTTASDYVKPYIKQLTGQGSLEVFAASYLQYLLCRYAEAKQKGVPFEFHRPLMVIIDYLQAVTDDKSGTNYTETVANVAKALAEGHIREFAKRAGLDFEAICEEQLGYVPHDIEGHKVAVLVTAQYRKAEVTEPYNPENPQHRKNLTRYVPILDGEPAWEPRLGDQPRRFAESELEGRGTIKKHSTVLLEGYRPTTSESDSRYVIMTDKTRNGQAGVFVLAWGSAPGAKAGMIFDPQAMADVVMHLNGVCVCYRDPDPRRTCLAGSAHRDGICDCVDRQGNPIECVLSGLDLDAWKRDSFSPSIALRRGTVRAGELTRCAPLIYKREPLRRSQMAETSYTS